MSREAKAIDLSKDFNLDVFILKQADSGAEGESGALQ